MPSTKLQEKRVAGSIFGICMVMWLLGVMTSVTADGLIHVLLAVVIVSSIWRIGWHAAQGESADKQDCETRQARWFSGDTKYDAMLTPRANRLRKVA